MELAEKVDLIEFFTVGSSGFSEEIARHFFKQILEGLDHVHSHGFAHRDLKLENILVDQNYRLKLTDFGFIAPLEGRDKSGFLKTRLGTMGYRAPEMKVQKEGYLGKNADVFSCGVILFMLLFRFFPFKEATSTDPIYKCIINNRADLFWRWHEKQLAKASGLDQSSPQNFVSQDFKDLVTSLL